MITFHCFSFSLSHSPSVGHAQCRSRRHSDSSQIYRPNVRCLSLCSFEPWTDGRTILSPPVLPAYFLDPAAAVAAAEAAAAYSSSSSSSSPSQVNTALLLLLRRPAELSCSSIQTVLPPYLVVRREPASDFPSAPCPPARTRRPIIAAGFACLLW